MKRIVSRLLILVVMVTTLVILSLSTATQASSLCSDCALSCANEAWFYMIQCKENGGSDAKCQEVYSDYSNGCKTLFCNIALGCSLPVNN